VSGRLEPTRASRRAWLSTRAHDHAERFAATVAVCPWVEVMRKRGAARSESLRRHNPFCWRSVGLRPSGDRELPDIAPQHFVSGTEPLEVLRRPSAQLFRRIFGLARSSPRSPAPIDVAPAPGLPNQGKRKRTPQSPSSRKEAAASGRASFTGAPEVSEWASCEAVWAKVFSSGVHTRLRLRWHRL